MSETGRGRGRGARRSGSSNARSSSTTRKPKTKQYEYITGYKPSPEIVDSLYHISAAPPIITRNLSSACPIAQPHAESKIIDRQHIKDENGVLQWVYIVRIRTLEAMHHRSSQQNMMEGLGDLTQEDEEWQENWKETNKMVNVSRILKFVSQRELERFENAMYRQEGELQAIVDREAIAKEKQARLARNKMVVRGRGRPHGSRTERGGMAMAPSYSASDGIPDADNGLEITDPDALNDADGDILMAVDDAALYRDASPQPEIAETDDEMNTNEDKETNEEDEDELAAAPSISPKMRNPFMANSALHSSPNSPHSARARSRSHPAVRIPNRVSQISQADIDIEGDDSEDEQSVSSDVQQLLSERSERKIHAHAIPETDDGASDELRESPSKRRRTESTTSSRRPSSSRRPNGNGGRSMLPVASPLTHRSRPASKPASRRPTSRISRSSSLETASSGPDILARFTGRFTAQEREIQDTLDTNVLIPASSQTSYRATNVRNASQNTVIPGTQQTIAASASTTQRSIAATATATQRTKVSQRSTAAAATHKNVKQRTKVSQHHTASKRTNVSQGPIIVDSDSDGWGDRPLIFDSPTPTPTPTASPETLHQPSHQRSSPPNHRYPSDQTDELARSNSLFYPEEPSFIHPGDDEGVHNEGVPAEEVEEEEEYTVEAILGHRFHDGINHYLVKWEGYEDPSDRSWLPETALDSARELVEEYEHKRRARQMARQTGAAKRGRGRMRPTRGR